MSEMRARSSLATLYCALLGVVAVGVAIVLARRGPSLDVGAVLLLGGLFALSENQTVELPGEADASAGFMLAMASIVVFNAQDSLLGPLLVGMFGGLHLGQIRARDWRKVVFNSANYGLATLAAAMIFDAFAPANVHEPGILLLLALPSALAFAVVDVGLYSVAIFLETRELPATMRTLVAVLGQMLPFAVLGVFLGLLYVDNGAVLVPLFIVPMLVARQAFASYLEIRESQEAAVRTLIGALEAKDPYTAGHAERVAGYAHYIGQELSMSPARLDRLRFAALMHDVGKLVVPNHLLNKKGKLTAEEFALVRMHEDVSVEILTRIDFLAPVAPSATSEAAEFAPVADERGQPIEPHIVAVADAFDAMTSTRSYRKALTQETAFSELRKNSGKQFHPRVVDALIAALERRHEVHGRDHEQVVHHHDAPEVGTGSAGLGDLLPADAQVADTDTEQAAGR
jgi:HD-GYP domain-containing protein (c-di-GMP phosphodiesterase class II)